MRIGVSLLVLEKQAINSCDGNMYCINKPLIMSQTSSKVGNKRHLPYPVFHTISDVIDNKYYFLRQVQMQNYKTFFEFFVTTFF